MCVWTPKFIIPLVKPNFYFFIPRLFFLFSFFQSSISPQTLFAKPSSPREIKNVFPTKKSIFPSSGPMAFSFAVWSEGYNRRGGGEGGFGRGVSAASRWDLGEGGRGKKGGWDEDAGQGLGKG